MRAYARPNKKKRTELCKIPIYEIYVDIKRHEINEKRKGEREREREKGGGEKERGRRGERTSPTGGGVRMVEKRNL